MVKLATTTSITNLRYDHNPPNYCCVVTGIASRYSWGRADDPPLKNMYNRLVMRLSNDKSSTRQKCVMGIVVEREIYIHRRDIEQKKGLD